jgi:hypothetical protein
MAKMSTRTIGLTGTTTTTTTASSSTETWSSYIVPGVRSGKSTSDAEDVLKYTSDTVRMSRESEMESRRIAAEQESRRRIVNIIADAFEYLDMQVRQLDASDMRIDDTFGYRLQCNVFEKRKAFLLQTLRDIALYTEPSALEYYLRKNECL